MSSTPQLKVVQKNLQVLGIDPDATRVYIEVLRVGPCSVLQVSRATGISRTQTYRHIEQLQANGLVNAEQLDYGTLFNALPIDNLEGLIASREAETAAIKRNLAGIAATVNQLAQSTGPASTTRHFYGIGGLKQASWNLTKATRYYKVFEAAHLGEHLDKAFARRCHERCAERQLTSYNLTNRDSVKSKDIEPFDPGRTLVRHIDPQVLRINFEMYMYDDVVTLLDYSKQQPHATEIHHPALKAMIEQLFDAMWSIAQPLKIS